MIIKESKETDKKRQLFWCFQRGFKHGVCANAADPRFTEHESGEIVAAYCRGYEKGRDVSMLTMAEECDRLGYDARLSILRGPAPQNPPAEHP